MAWLSVWCEQLSTLSRTALSRTSHTMQAEPVKSHFFQPNREATMPGFCLAAVLCSKLGGATDFCAVSSKNGLMAIRLGLGGIANSLGGWLKSFQLSRLSSRYSASQSGFAES